MLEEPAGYGAGTAMIWLAFKLWELIDCIRDLWWEACTWVRIRIRPDKRPMAVMLADVKDRLERMPAAKEIHEAYRLIERVEAAQPGKKGESR